jgi:hypothetical protein
LKKGCRFKIVSGPKENPAGARRAICKREVKWMNNRDEV